MIQKMKTLELGQTQSLVTNKQLYHSYGIKIRYSSMEVFYWFQATKRNDWSKMVWV